MDPLQLGIFGKMYKRPWAFLSTLEAKDPKWNHETAKLSAGSLKIACDLPYKLNPPSGCMRRGRKAYIEGQRIKFVLREILETIQELALGL